MMMMTRELSFPRSIFLIYWFVSIIAISGIRHIAHWIIYDFPIVDTFAGLRPASQDNAPILGLTPIGGLILAAGHFRKGILLTPVTSNEISQLILTGSASEVIKPFNISRFGNSSH